MDSPCALCTPSPTPSRSPVRLLFSLLFLLVVAASNELEGSSFADMFVDSNTPSESTDQYPQHLYSLRDAEGLACERNSYFKLIPFSSNLPSPS